MLHITENGVQDVNGGIAQNGNGAVTGVTIQRKGFFLLSVCNQEVMVKGGNRLGLQLNWLFYLKNGGYFKKLMIKGD